MKRLYKRLLILGATLGVLTLLLTACLDATLLLIINDTDTCTGQPPGPCPINVSLVGVSGNPMPRDFTFSDVPPSPPTFNAGQIDSGVYDLSFSGSCFSSPRPDSLRVRPGTLELTIFCTANGAAAMEAVSVE